MEIFFIFFYIYFIQFVLLVIINYLESSSGKYNPAQHICDKRQQKKMYNKINAIKK